MHICVSKPPCQGSSVALNRTLKQDAPVFIDNDQTSKYSITSSQDQVATMERG